MSDKLNFKDYVEKYFEPLTHDVWTSVYEKVEVGFAPSDLSHYEDEDLRVSYEKYLDGSEDFLEYDET